MRLNQAKNSWGHIELIEMVHKPLIMKTRTGEEYVADTHGGPLTMLLRCGCGHQWEIEAAKFPGRRHVRACGRPQCPYTPKPKPIRTRGAQFSVYLSAERAALIAQWGAEKGLSFSKAVDELIGEYFLQKLLDED